MTTCQVCGRNPKVGYNRPNSQHRTKRKIYPNIQKTHGRYICMTCLRTADRNLKKAN